MSVKRVEVVLRSYRNALPFPCNSPGIREWSWKKTPKEKKQQLQWRYFLVKLQAQAFSCEFYFKKSYFIYQLLVTNPGTARCECANWHSNRHKSSKSAISQPLLTLILSYCYLNNITFSFVWSTTINRTNKHNLLEVHSEPSQISWMKFFAKIVNGWKLLTILAKKLRLRCLTILWIHLCLMPWK